MVSETRTNRNQLATREREIGQAIRFYRGARSQREVAASAGIHPATWSLYESGRRQPKRSSLERICHALGCSIPEFERAVWRFRRVRVAATAPALAARHENDDPIRKDLIELTAPLVDQLVELLLWLRRAEP
jgi:transcriptional regulator with XRE-family HTH domain